MSEWKKFYKRLCKKYTFFQTRDFDVNIFEELKDDFEEEFERQTEQIFKELEQRVSKKLKIEDNDYSNESGSFVYEFSSSRYFLTSGSNFELSFRTSSILF